MLQYELFPHDKEITRKEAARIVHEYINNVGGEPDEDNIEGAAVLKDLYDCGVCVNHIAQVYLKGIMEPVLPNVFGADEILSQEDARNIILRIENSSQRAVPVIVEATIAYISLDDISTLKAPVVIDVRTSREYNIEHFKGAANIPLSKYVLNPYAIGDDKYSEYVFVCDKGANAEIAANCAKKHGYVNLFCSSYM